MDHATFGLGLELVHGAQPYSAWEDIFVLRPVCLIPVVTI